MAIDECLLFKVILHDKDDAMTTATMKATTVLILALATIASTAAIPSTDQAPLFSAAFARPDDVLSATHRHWWTALQQKPAQREPKQEQDGHHKSPKTLGPGDGQCFCAGGAICCRSEEDGATDCGYGLCGL